LRTHGKGSASPQLGGVQATANAFARSAAIAKLECRGAAEGLPIARVAQHPEQPGNAREHQWYQAASVARGLQSGATQPLQDHAIADSARAFDPMQSRSRIDRRGRAAP